MKKTLILIAAMTTSITLAGCSHKPPHPPMDPEMASCHQQIQQMCPEAMGPEQVGECLVQHKTSFAQICPTVAAKRDAQNQCEESLDKLCPNAAGPEQIGECLAKQGKTYAEVCPLEAEEKQKRHDEWKEHHPDDHGHWGMEP
jgi:hypothetical protein